MTPFYYTYIAMWLTACLAAVWLMVKHRREIELFHRTYWRYILVPWKLTTFLVAMSAFVVLAPYTGDPAWDYIDATFMSILTWMSAPWSVGILYLYWRGQERLRSAFIAICVWMFSASWSYDIYLVFRDGYYPVTWYTNIAASSILYLSAGLLWNLQYVEGKGVTLGFLEPSWPTTGTNGNFSRILVYALPFMLIAAAVFVPFIL